MDINQEVIIIVKYHFLKKIAKSCRLHLVKNEFKIWMNVKLYLIFFLDNGYQKSYHNQNMNGAGGYQSNGYQSNGYQNNGPRNYGKSKQMLNIINILVPSISL